MTRLTAAPLANLTQKTPSNYPLAMKPIRQHRLHSIFAFLALYIAMASIAQATPYWVVIDAGSTGSRLFLYKIKSSTPKGLDITLLSIPNNRVSPGISTDLNSCGPYISGLFVSLKDYLSSANIAQKDVTVSLQATAGMRVVSPVNQSKCYSAVQDELKAQLPDAVIGPIKTIQGRYEGAFEWLSVNYLKGNLNANSATLGVLEVGGGSYQMTFESPGKLDTIDFINVPFGNISYSLFSRSYTGIGGNFSREDATDDPDAFQAGFALASGATGTGHYHKGKLSARSTILTKPVRIPPQAKLPPLASFIGVGLFSNVAADFNLGSQISSDSIDAAATVFAKQSYDVNTTDPNLFSRVFRAQFISELIRTWFPASKTLKVEDTINGNEITWTLGSAAYMASGGVIP